LEVAFSATATSIDKEATVSFTDASVGNPTSWAWQFEGGVPDSSVTQNPTGITYSTPGIYDVTLTVTNAEGTLSLTKSGLITVVETAGRCDSITSITDIDGNVYNVVTIGGQCWTVENLRTTRFRNGVAIPLVADSLQWKNKTTPAYCWYNDDDTKEAVYGKLYNWFTVVNANGLCPAGWHVPTDFEWTQLTTFLQGTDVAGGKLKETGTSNWEAPNQGASDMFGFKALPGGYRFSDGGFYYFGTDGLYWSSTNDGSLGWHRSFNNSTEDSYRAALFRKNGYSCRCIKN